MARDYARIMTAIWRNSEFRALDEAPQRMYLLLVTQPEISAAGVLALRIRRWADMAKNSTAESMVQVLKELEAGRFIFVDWDAEELLIRSFIRWDGGFNNPKRRPVIVRDASDVVSVTITRHLMMEFQRCGIPTPDMPPDGPSRGASPSHVDSLSGSPSEINRVDLGSDPFPQVDSLSDTAPTNHGVVVTYCSSETATLNPQPLKPTVSTSSSAKIVECRDDVDQLCTRLRDRIVENGFKTPTITDDWRRQARLLIDKDGRQLAQSLHLIDWATTDPFWYANIRSMAKFRTQYDVLSARARQASNPHNRPATPRPSTTDQRTAAAQALKTRFIDGANVLAFPSHPPELPQ